ncbi:MAG: outer membrane beta-barrel protein, partial [Phaeodactylibacter sp.]|nr:outer membrane beta-barrel protein [Phaeodactylibacter sp.]
LAFSHQFSDTRKVTLSFNQRIDRPGFQILAPAFYFLDVNTLLAGNINALPTISTTTTLGLTLGTLNLSVAYTDEDQPLAGFQPITNSENNLVVFQSVNIEDNDLVTASLVFPWEVTDFWTARFNLLANWRRAETLIDAMPVVNKGWAYFLNTTQSFQIGENLGIELTGRYNSKVVVGLSTFLPRISFDLAVRKTFANKSKLSLSWLDLFNQGSYFALLQDDPQRDIYYNWKYELEGNILRLTYSMPFGNSHLKTKPQRRAGSEEVQQRATN